MYMYKLTQSFPKGSWYEQFESILPQDAYTQVSDFLAKWFLGGQ